MQTLGIDILLVTVEGTLITLLCQNALKRIVEKKYWRASAKAMIFFEASMIFSLEI